MIKKIVFQNLFSFDKQQIIDFDSEVQVYAIYGKNSAGKSNFLKVLGLVDQFITGSFNINDIARKKSANSTNDIVSIEVLLENNNTGIEYGYGIEINTNFSKIIEEKFMNITNNKVYLHYSKESVNSEVLDPKTLEILNKYNVANNGMMKYLKELKQVEVLKEIIELQNFFIFENFHSYSYLQNDKNIKEIMLKEIKKIDVAIQGFQLIDQTKLKEKLMKEASTKEMKQNIDNNINSFEILTEHKKFNIDLKNESKGTQKYFRLIYETLLIEEKYGFSILDIDELEMHFHDELYKKFIEFFKEHTNNQLIFTTHNQIILEEKLLPKSNIIFIDKKEDSSEIYKLEDFEGVKDDNNHNWKKMYNIDRFGAFPNVR